MLLSQVILVAPGRPDDADRVSFNRGTRSVCAFFGRLIQEQRIDLGKFTGITIECVRESRRTESGVACGVLHWEYEIDFQQFLQMDSVHKKLFTFNLLQGVLGELTRILKWDPSAFHRVFDQMQQENLVNSWYWKKGTKWSTNRKLQATIRIDHEVDYCDIVLLIRDQDGKVIDSRSLVRTIPHELVYSVHLGKLVWVGNDELCLQPKIPSERPVRVRIHSAGSLSIVQG